MTAIGETLNTSHPAVPAVVPAARRMLGDLAAAAGARPEKVEAIRLAVSEAMTNVVLHAYRDAPGDVYITAAVVANELWVLIADDGCGLDHRSDSAGLGLGLALISQQADDFEIGPRAAGGTEVRMRFHLVADEAAPAAHVPRWRGQLRGSVAAASRPASARFSTTT
jgi:anti-sigma regulatory factor (Ser/Thr protein kinase)